MKARILEKIEKSLATAKQRALCGVVWPGASEVCRKAAKACENYREYGVREGVVYFVRCGEFVKIGRTRAGVGSRTKAFAVGCPYDFSLEARVYGDAGLEKDLHEIFAEQRHRGEWFRVIGPVKEFLAAVKYHPIGKADDRWAEKWIPPGRETDFERLSLLAQL